MRLSEVSVFEVIVAAVEALLLFAALSDWEVLFFQPSEALPPTEKPASFFTVAVALPPTSTPRSVNCRASKAMSFVWLSVLFFS